MEDLLELETDEKKMFIFFMKITQGQKKVLCFQSGDSAVVGHDAVIEAHEKLPQPVLDLYILGACPAVL